MKVCLEPATPTQRFAEDMDCSNMVGTSVTFSESPLGNPIVGVVVKAWVEDGSLYADLDMRADLTNDDLEGFTPVGSMRTLDIEQEFRSTPEGWNVRRTEP